MDYYTALFRVFAYLFCALMMVQAATFINSIRGGLVATAGILGLQAINAFLIFARQIEARDFVLSWIATPYLFFVAIVWLVSAWKIGKAK